MANSEAEASSDAAQALGSEYQVFLSFRGHDTRHGFTDFLYHGLIDAGVRVFKEDDELRVGEVIGENLLYAINNSILYIPIFSRTYASSKWCLQELALMVDRVSKSEDQKSILPIFLDVQPEDLKLKTPLYSTAFEKHKDDFPEEVEAWRKALAEVDEIKGWNVKKDQSQAAIVKLVVEKVLEKLEIKRKSVTEHLVGLDDRVKHLTELLDVDHRDVRLIGIYGKGGIGKTTVAKVIFNKLSSHFGKCCSFLEYVRESLLTKEGIAQLQRKFLSDISGFGSAEQLMDSEQAMRRIGDTLSTKKVLVVLDDVDKKEHIKKLIGGYSLCSGSRIIITMRSKIVINIKELKDGILWYEMLKMDDGLALRLFSKHAFGREFPLDDYHELSTKIVSSTGGLPLTVEVIGSLLNGKDEAFWKETLVRLREVPEEDILETLRISYGNLDKYQQQIFLDIACFLFNENKTDAIYMWADCQFYPIRGLKVLTDRCLIKILDNDKIWMHDQLIDLGRRIVRQESPFNPGKRTRLWIAKEALEIIRTKKRKDEIQALKIFSSGDTIEITDEDFERLQNLRFLELNCGTYAGDFARCHSNLRWFSWHSPRDFRADNMYLDRLVVCKLDSIDFKDDSKAWDLIKRAQNLKVLSITRCFGITTIPDFSKCLRLERLTLADCFNLERIESFIGDLMSLIELKIEECTSLTDLPEEVGALVKLKHFSLSGCRGLRELPGSLGNLTSLTELDLSDTIIRELPNSIGKLISLRILRLPIGALVYQEDHVWQLPSGISTLVNLEELDLSRRHVTGEIPVGIRELSSLRILNLEHTRIYKIPTTINMLHHLQTLNLRSCHEIQVLPELPTSLTCLLLRSESLLSVPNLSNLTHLVELLLSIDSSLGKKSNLIPGCNLRWIGRLRRLKKLELDLLNVPAPPELAYLSYLEELKLSCLDLETLMQHPSSFWSLRNLSTLEFYSCEVEDISLDRLPRLEELTVCGCKRLQRLSIPLELRKLRQVRVSYCPELVEIQVERLSKSLESLNIYECESLTKIGDLSYSMNLEYLRIQRCKQLTNVEGLNGLESLKSLDVTHCPSLRRLIYASCTNIPDDCLVKIHGCGDFIKDSTQSSSFGISFKSYREEILLDTSNFESKSDELERLFTVIFHLGVKKPGGWLDFVGGIKRKNENVTPNSVTYKGLIADIKGFGFCLKRMWYETPDLLREIKSDGQVKGMVQLASKSGSIHLYVEGGVDIEWEGEYDYEMMEMLREEWAMKTDDSDEDGERATACRTSKESCNKETEEEKAKEKTEGGERATAWRTSKEESYNQGMTKMVLKLDLHDDKDKKKAMKMVSGFGGVESIIMDMKDKKLTVTGHVDPVELVGKLRKMFPAEIISVGPPREAQKKDDNKSNKDSKADPAKASLYPFLYNSPPPYYYGRNASVEEDPNACVIC